MEIDVGSVVMLVGEYERPHDPINGAAVTIKNRTGVVRVINQRGVGVEFDEMFPGGHNLNNAIDNLRGWYVPSASLMLLRPVKDIIKSLYMEE